MPVVNPLARELVFKIVYYGPGLGGKTTTLQHIHATTKPEHRGKMVSLATPVDRTLYFDFLPIRVPNVRGMGVRLQLFTVPGQVYYNATRKLVLTGADGVVIVFDSQRLRSDANLESLENLYDNLREHGRALAEIPHVIQFNKRDLVDTVPIHELESKLNRTKSPAFSTVATRGDGVFESPRSDHARSARRLRSTNARNARRGRSRAGVARGRTGRGASSRGRFTPAELDPRHEPEERGTPHSERRDAPLAPSGSRSRRRRRARGDRERRSRARDRRFERSSSDSGFPRRRAGGGSRNDGGAGRPARDHTAERVRPRARRPARGQLQAFEPAGIRRSAGTPRALRQRWLRGSLRSR